MRVEKEEVDGRPVYKKGRFRLEEKVILLGILVLLVVMDVFLGIQILGKI